MALKIYTDISTKERSDFIKDIRPHFLNNGIPDTQYSRQVLEYIDEAKYFDEVSFINKWGIRSDMKYLSDTGKCMLMLPVVNGIVNGDECGWNCGVCLLACNKGSIYIPGDRIRYLTYLTQLDNVKTNIILYGKHFSNYWDYYDYLEEVY